MPYGHICYCIAYIKVNIFPWQSHTHPACQTGTVLFHCTASLCKVGKMWVSCVWNHIFQIHQCPGGCACGQGQGCGHYELAIPHKKDLQCFLRLLNFYQRFVRHFKKGRICCRWTPQQTKLSHESKKPNPQHPYLDHVGTCPTDRCQGLSLIAVGRKAQAPASALLFEEAKLQCRTMEQNYRYTGNV